MAVKATRLLLAIMLLAAVGYAKPYHKRVHSHLHAKIFRQELVPDTAPLDEPQGRLGDSERWMSWEPKAPASIPDNMGDSSEDDEDDEDEDEDDSEDESLEEGGKTSDLKEKEDDNESEEDSQELPFPTQSQGDQQGDLLTEQEEEEQEEEEEEEGKEEEGSEGSDQKSSTSLVEQTNDPEQPDRLATPARMEREGKPTTPANPPVLLVSEGFEIPIKASSKSDSFKEKDLCASVYCHYGRVCEKGLCVCAGSDYCAGHNKAVCGTDGVTYPSHCELHRMACVNGQHIGIDHSGKRCRLATTGRNEPKEETFLFEDQVQKANTKATPKYELLQQNLQEEKLKVEIKKGKQQQQPAVVAAAVPVVPCTEPEYEHLKSNLMQYHCARIGEPDCTSNSPRKQFVANIMFNYYDRNNNQALDEAELEDIEHRDHLEKLSRFCSLTDMLTFDDLQEDGNITLPEFYSAFRVPTVLLDEDLKVFTTRVTAGNSIELKCDIKGAVEIIWKRNSAILDDSTTSEIKTFDDGSLYISNLGLHHMGNYTCQDRYNEHVIQTHILRVQLAPRVRVSPSTQFHTSGSSVTLKCHADGVPEPEVMWEMNEAPLTNDPTEQHYVRMHNNATLEIRQAVYTKDTGAYKCKARNSAGQGQDIATVFIENSHVPKYYTSEDMYEVFLVFHDKGYTAYEPTHCHIEHQVSGSFSMFKLLPEYGETMATLCPDSEPCSWGDAVNVRNKFIYITQPKLNRVIVVEIQDRSNPVEVIPTDKVPVSVHYIEHLDQVWVLCWNGETSGGSKTVVVIRQASEEMQHHTVHTQPIANRFDLVKDMFLPPNNDLQHKFPYGYVVHMEQSGLYKLDLATMKYIKNIDLSKYNCVPKSATFIPMGGQVLVHCVTAAGSGSSRSWQLVLDYITDAVLSETELTGDAYISPDGRYVVVVDDNGDTLTIHKVLDNGIITKAFDEYTNLHIAGVTFFPSERGRSYDFYASSVNKNDVLYMNLASGKVELIEGVGQAMKPEEWKWSRHNRVIVSGGVFGEYLMTPSRDSVVIIDGRRRHVQCEWQDIAHGNVIVWVEPMHL